MFLDEKLLQSIKGIKFTHWGDKSHAEERIIECLLESILENEKELPIDNSFSNLRAMLKRHYNALSLVIRKMKKDGVVLFKDCTYFGDIFDNYCKKKFPLFITKSMMTWKL